MKCEGEENCSCTFLISLKQGKKHLQEAQILKNKMLKDNFATDFAKTLPVEPQNFKPLPEKKSASSKKNLYIIDDNDEIREFLIDILQDEYNIKEFSSACEA